ncbi:MAG: J domain-containing protein [Prochloraceae cyanobacterium]|nr:J domain-containing protein [Prochloraceae cyanobacterium]
MENQTTIEEIFREKGINYELRGCFYLCLIEGRQFYYSPQTGKWRMKGRRVWLLSNSPLEFIRFAIDYIAPGSQSSNAQQQQQNSKKQSSRNKNRQQRTKANSSKQERKTGKINEIREEFIEQFGKHLERQRSKNYKIIWIWYRLLDDFMPTPLEICWLSVVFEYSPWWAVRQIESMYIVGERESILNVIKKNQDDWLNYFNNRWGQHHESTNDHERHRQSREQSRGARQEYREPKTHSTHSSARVSSIYQYYIELLKLSFPFTFDELKSAYRQRALETHPDIGGTAEAFREVNTAYEFLSSTASK